MISYLKGKKIDITKTTQNRLFLVLEVNKIGYEMQISSRFARQLDETTDEEIQVFTHLQIQEDKQILYGFDSAAERDLFRQLTAVSGIGMQLAIASIDTLGISELVGAIVTSNITTLSKIPGVGKKTAERIALELKTKLAKWHKVSGIKVEQPEAVFAPKPEIKEDLEMTLLALGYSNEEIEQVLTALSRDEQLLNNPHAEEWIRSAIAWLSGE
ncbi:Holliday junction branch migration protein RuvA [Waterburya agarophytonicola K14]|uniref:Holliday junction branch migration complex subunit RuvA n=1 Tax=Waterburya agarophytonicola KI4 TaxID=2874699 RepID=A0A964BQL1_9CYAN|nr:Holliday junction branch migration protein RuvA [Waterburya agarophytonicola]MCC0177474.1 Holliday junction branch migration protein RuvA [Waterburya agarophytonicola KI4]